MKSLIFLPLLITIHFAMAQIEVKEVSTNHQMSELKVIGKVENPVSFVAELCYRVSSENASDTVYEFKYRNFLYSAVHKTVSITFKGSTEGIQLLYEKFRSIFLEENKHNKSFVIKLTLGSTNVTLIPFKSGGKIVAKLANQNSYALLNEMQVEKLFGKQ